MCASVESSVRTQLDSISSISMNIVYSNAIKMNFREFSTTFQRDGTPPADQAASREKAMAIHDIVTAMIGAYQSASEINLYTMDGSCVEAGYWLRTTTVDLERLPWYSQTLALNGHKYITAPVVNRELPAKGENQKSQKFISLVRLFLDTDGKPEGIVEVVQDCDRIFSLSSQLESQNPDSRVFIYNSRQELVYPYASDSSYPDYYAMITHTAAAEGQAGVLNTESSGKFLFTYQTIEGYDWTVILVRPQSAFYKSLSLFRTTFFLIGALSILVTLFICFFISKRLTVPLEKLTAATGKITISRVLDEKKVNLTSADSSIKELSLLCESIRSMYEKLRSTSQEVLLSKSEETRAKFQAAQSLINPHFLYNCLTNISVMAEENMNEDIIRMCRYLCDYFRYISSSREMIVPLKEEIFYTECYLNCMQMRFHEGFTYNMNIGEGTEQIYIPKLIIQPIVENVFKYGFQITPPWQLSISSYSENGQWYLKVEDNGGLLSEEKKEELLKLYENLDMNKEWNSLQIGNMGLKNVCLRLRLLYGTEAVFQIDCSTPGRTSFIVGGPIYQSREEYYEHHPEL
ncbi:cache domain-containing sensor histidine kinase [Lacrimispora amygdalina]|nr:histidine kinase [Clostridium indicum]